tara:strand:+ start:332 stop:832 length:501 start_codon:yes stop_codon:yes gene_type:complete
MKFKKSVFILFLAGFSLLAQTDLEKQQIDSQLNVWHKAAADADFDAYFNLMTDDAIFIGTDATENWNVEEFKAFAKPYFDRGKAWNFTAIDRNIFLDQSKNIAWFDELLSTQMGICRGSGVLVKNDGRWKIKHYVLSIAIPNDDVDQVTAIKKEHDSLFISKVLQN